MRASLEGDGEAEGGGEGGEGEGVAIFGDAGFSVAEDEAELGVAEEGEGRAAGDFEAGCGVGGQRQEQVGAEAGGPDPVGLAGVARFGPPGEDAEAQVDRGPIERAELLDREVPLQIEPEAEGVGADREGVPFDRRAEAKIGLEGVDPVRADRGELDAGRDRADLPLNREGRTDLVARGPRQVGGAGGETEAEEGAAA